MEKSMTAEMKMLESNPKYSRALNTPTVHETRFLNTPTLHLTSGNIFLLHKFRLARIMFRQERHKKLLTLFGIDSPQISFHRPLSWDWLLAIGITIFSSARNLEPDFTV